MSDDIMTPHDVNGRWGLRNQGDKLFKPLRYSLRIVAGACPSCIIIGELQARPAEIYRRSEHSVTFRCQHCAMQWAVTFARVHRVAVARLKKGIKDKKVAAAYEFAAEQTKFAADDESKRANAITRQSKRRVIRLPDAA